MNYQPRERQSFKVKIDMSVEPRWKGLVDKWYQLDSISFALSEVGHQLKEKLTAGNAQIDFILLCAVGGSNQADREFIESGYASPGKFVYTLPNVPISPLCQVIQWRGQTRCVVCRENELDIVHREAAEIAEFEKKSVALFIVDQTLIESYKNVEFALYRSW